MPDITSSVQCGCCCITLSTPFPVRDVFDCAMECDTSSSNSSQCGVGTGRARSAAPRADCRAGGHGGLAGQMCGPSSTCRMFALVGQCQCQLVCFKEICACMHQVYGVRNCHSRVSACMCLAANAGLFIGG